jgi:GT2 family glycosyltransferase
MVTKLLHQCGLYLGPESELISATPDNPDGHWEHMGFQSVNDEILGRLGGGWDHPPPLPADWAADGRLDPTREKAHQLIAQFDGREPWGWKDPRTSLTFPFWQELLTDLKVVVCLRNPLEVALSLRRRGLCSYALGLDLWKTYTKQILATSRPECRVVTHYGAYFADQAAELRRVLSFLALHPSEAMLATCAATTKTDFRHHCFTTRHLREIGVGCDILETYQLLCKEADFADTDAEEGRQRHPDRNADAPGASYLDMQALEVEILRQDVRRLQRSLGERDATIASLRTQLDEGRAAVAHLKSVITSRDDTIEQLQQRISTLREQADNLSRERDGLLQALDAQSRSADRFQALFGELRDEWTRRDEDLQALLSDLVSSGAVSQGKPGPSSHRLAYRPLVGRLREMVRAQVPRDAIVAVISKGDDELVRLSGRRGWHFPQDERGVYAGYYPASGLAAVAHLEVLRARGAQYLLLPETAAWWLDSYPEFQAHLEARYRVACREEAGTLYSVCEARTPAETTSEGTLTQLVSRFRAARGREPCVLDWDTGQRLAALFPGLPVFAPPVANGRLPYVDRSVDVVAVATESREVLAEAKRVAEVAVVNFRNGATDGSGPDLFWIEGPLAQGLPTASIIIPVFNGWRHTAACLAALRETLPQGFNGEILVVDDASTDETPYRLAQRVEQDGRLRVLRNPTNGGFIDGCNRGAAAATGEFLVFLNNDTVPLPGWLAPLLHTFDQFPEVGAAGGKLLFPDGRLQEAGAIVFRDASAAHFGRGEADASEELFGYVREVDYCSGALLATRRSLFEEFGGFDSLYRPGYYEDVDYCFRLRQKGFRVYYQPESVVVHLEGASSGTDPSSGMKQHQATNLGRFRERWRDVLEGHPPRPTAFDRDTWYVLAHRTREVAWP